MKTKSKTKPKQKPTATKKAKKPSASRTKAKPRGRRSMSTEKAPEKHDPKAQPGVHAPGKTHNTPDDLKTEQEKGGKDPISDPEPSPGPVETIQELGIGARDPYPDGNPPKIERYPDGTPVKKEEAPKAKAK